MAKGIAWLLVVGAVGAVVACSSSSTPDTTQSPSKNNGDDDASASDDATASDDTSSSGDAAMKCTQAKTYLKAFVNGLGGAGGDAGACNDCVNKACKTQLTSCGTETCSQCQSDISSCAQTCISECVSFDASSFFDGDIPDAAFAPCDDGGAAASCKRIGTCCTNMFWGSFIKSAIMTAAPGHTCDDLGGSCQESTCAMILNTSPMGAMGGSLGTLCP